MNKRKLQHWQNKKNLMLTLKYFVPFSFVKAAKLIFSSLLNSQFSLLLKI